MATDRVSPEDGGELALMEITHSSRIGLSARTCSRYPTSRVVSPQCSSTGEQQKCQGTKNIMPYNGICKRLNKTILQKFYQVALCRKLYRSVAEPQADLDAWMREYNIACTYQDRWCYGRIPMQTFIDVVLTAKEKLLQAG